MQSQTPLAPTSGCSAANVGWWGPRRTSKPRTGGVKLNGRFYRPSRSYDNRHRGSRILRRSNERTSGNPNARPMHSQTGTRAVRNPFPPPPR